MLFRQLPEQLFSPLAGPNRAVYAQVLTGLYPLFFEHSSGHLFPSRELVKAEIEEIVARMAAFQWEREEDEGAEDIAAGAEAGHAYRIYRRLVACGWLEEEAEGYRVMVVVPPHVGTLLGSLVEITGQERVFYGGIVLSIYNNVRNAREDPEGQALAFREACRDAQRFSRHLNSMVYGLKGLMAQISELTSRRFLLSSFFEDFVERFLVADYKRLKTRNNPFRFRGQILSLVQEMRYDPQLRRHLQRAYQEQMGIGEAEAARAELDRDFYILATVFEQVDHHLERIDRYRYRFERRAADSIRYMDRTIPGAAARLARLIEGMGRAVHGLDESGWADLPIPLADVLPLTPAGLRPPRGVRQPPAPEPLRVRPVDPDRLALQKALRAYLERRRVDVNRIVAYIERHLGERAAMDGEEFAIDSVEDYIAFTHIRHLPRLGAAGKRAAQGYRIEALEGEMENEHLRCPRFRVAREEKERTLC